MKSFDQKAVSNENDVILKEMGIVCPTRLGEHKCNVQTRFGWCCDVCLEEELLWLKQQGVHTINSCCGHGDNQLASILVVGENSMSTMECLGYKEACEQVGDPKMRAYKPKTIFPYSTPTIPPERRLTMEWFSVEDKTPDKTGEYLVNIHQEDKETGESGDFVLTAWYQVNELLFVPKSIGWKFFNEWANLTEQLRCDITHWMPLPLPPEK